MAGLRSLLRVVGAFTAAGFVSIACAKGDDAGLPSLPDAGDDGASDPNNSETLPGDDDTTTSSSSGGTTKRDGGTGDGGNVTSACATALGKAAWDFESGPQGWTHAVSDGATSNQPWPFDPWGQGKDTNNFPCPNGSCWGAEITENYAQCSRGELRSPTVDLSACAGQSVKLQFAQAYDFWTDTINGKTYFDGGIVELSSDGGSSWTVPPGAYPGTVTIMPDRGDGIMCVTEPYHTDGKPGFVGTQQVAGTFAVSVPAAMLTSKVRIRFSTGAGVSTDANSIARDGTGAGWRIDDVKFVGGP